MPIKQSIPIELGGKTRYLRYGINALVALEDETGKEMSDLFADLDSKKQRMKIRDFRALLWAGLLHDEPELTVNQVGNFIDEEGVGNIATKIGEAFAQTFPAEEDLKKKPPEKKGLFGTGKNT